MRMNGKVVVVTGASMGIGEAIAKAFADEGASVALSSRDLSRAEDARQRIGQAERTLAVACDVNDRTQIENLLRSVLDRFGRVDVWVNNAGFGLIDCVERMDMAACRRMFDTNLFGPIDAMQLVIPVMKNQGTGTIINVSSVAGHIAAPNMAAYGATKHALNCIGKAARVELLGTGVNVLTVCPGYVQTEFSSNAVRGADYRRIGGGGKRGVTAEYIARATLKAYLSGKRELIVPWYYRPLIGLYRLWPEGLERVMRAKMRPVETDEMRAN